MAIKIIENEIEYDNDKEGISYKRSVRVGKYRHIK